MKLKGDMDWGKKNILNVSGIWKITIHNIQKALWNEQMFQWKMLKKKKKVLQGLFLLLSSSVTTIHLLSPCLVEAIFSYSLLFTWWKWPVYKTRLQFQMCFGNFQELFPLSWSLTLTFWKGPHYSAQWAAWRASENLVTEPSGWRSGTAICEGLSACAPGGTRACAPCGVLSWVWHISAPRPCTP